MADKKKKLIVIDGHAIIYRAWHALPPLKTKKGLITNAVYGFTATILKAIKDMKPDYLIVALDEEGPTFRHEAYDGYKATREKQPDEFYAQIPYVKKVLEVLAITILSKKGFEADDIIGSIVNRFGKEPGLEIDIITKDFDIFQLIKKNVKVISLEKGISDFKTYDEDEVKKKYGLAPEQVVDFKALKGDPSDNIKGVPGIGEKTALDLIKKFESLDCLYKELEATKKIPAKLKEKLTTYKKEAFESKKLVKIVTDIPISQTLPDFEIKPIDTNEAYKLFSELEFRTLIPRLSTFSQEPRSVKTSEKVSYREPSSQDEIRNFFLSAAKVKVVSLDTETTGLDTVRDELVGASFSWKEKEGWWLTKKIINEHKEELALFLKNKDIEKVGHNIKFDLAVLTKAGFHIENISFDTMIASYLLSPGERNYTLDHQVFIEFGHRMTPITDLIGTGKDERTMAEVEPEKIRDYASADADFTLRLYKVLKEKIKKNGLERVFNDIEMPLIAVLSHMELSGIKIDVAELSKLNILLTKKLEKTEEKIYKLAGKTFNINSPQQLKEILFNRLKIPTRSIRSTKTGLSTAASELSKLKRLHPIIAEITTYRELSKLKSTYIDPLPKLINPETGRVHTSYNQTVTVTGRLSSSNPNLQNIPIRTEIGNQIRKAFVAEREYMLLSADYSQIELRIAAHLSKDKNMTEAFNKNRDIHRQTAAFINQVSEDKVTEEMRSKAKEINFGVLYGMNAYGISERTGVAPEEAQEFLDRYFSKYAELKSYRDGLIAMARKKGYAESIAGRKRYLPDLESQNFQLRQAAERMAINMPIQGSQADIIKIAMIECYRKLIEKEKEVKLILQVHDELVFEVPKQMAQDIASEVKSIMAGAYKLSVPLKVNVKIGTNWQELEELI